MRHGPYRPHNAVAVRQWVRAYRCEAEAAILRDMDWSACPDVESVPGKLSGAWVVRGTRVPADAILINAQDGYTPEDIVADLFPTVSLDAARRILMFAKRHEPRSA